MEIAYVFWSGEAKSSIYDFHPTQRISSLKVFPL